MPQPTPIEVSPRGGPQPAKKKKEMSTAESIGARLLGNLFRGNERSGNFGTADRKTGPMEEGEIRIVGPAREPKKKTVGSFPADSWKPDPEDVIEYLKSARSTTGVGFGGGSPSVYGPGGMGTGSPLQGEKITSTKNDKYINDPGLLYEAILNANSPEALADVLGYDDETVAEILSFSDQKKKALAQAEADREAIIARQKALSTQTPGGSSADAAERWANGPSPELDPLSLAEAKPMNSTELQELLVALSTQDVNEAPDRLDAAKNKIWNDTMAAQARVEEVNAAYRAGLAGAPLPEAPQPTESTMQEQYLTAQAQTASVANLDPMIRGLDTTDVDGAILQAAGLVEEKRAAQAQNEIALRVEAEMQARAAQEREIADEQAAADKAAADRAREAEDANFDAVSRRDWQEAGAEEAIKSASRDEANPVAEADKIFDMLRRRFASGASIDDAVAGVFGGGADSSTLTVPEMRLVQWAQVAAGGKIPPELKDDYEAWLAAARANAEGGS